MPITPLVSPTLASSGDPVLVAASNIQDTSRDDDFVSSISPGLWTASSAGLTNVTVSNGAKVELRKNGGGSSYSLLSVSTYVSGDVSVDYNITSQYLSDLPASEIVYAGLSLEFVSGEIITIKRVMGVQGQRVIVQYVVGGALHGSATRLASSSSGTLRLIRHGHILAAVLDGDSEPIFYSGINPTSNFRVRLFSTTNGQSEYLKAEYHTYRSNPGVLFGDRPMIVRTLSAPARVEGLIPSSTANGLVDVNTFNHTGLLGTAAGGFTYSLVLGQTLASNKQIDITLQNDHSLRD